VADQGGYDYGSVINDIDPSIIESVTVLKGPNAAALYGSRASNGAVIIETKKGQEAGGGGGQVVVSQQVTFEDELRLPSYQNLYGGGYAGDYAWYDGLGNGINDQADESWGPPLDQGIMIPQWFSPYDAACDCRTPAPWVSHPNNVDQFFDVGVTNTTNVSVQGATETLHGRASFSYMDLDGMQPGHQQKRTTFSVAGGIDAFDRLNITSSVQYITSEGQNRPGVGYGSDNIMGGFVWFNRQIDTQQLKDLWDDRRPVTDPSVGGFPYSWTTLYWVNPYFKAFGHRNEDERDRLIGQVSATYQLTPWLSAMVRTGTDWYQDTRLKAYSANPQIAIAGDYTTNPLTAGREYISPTGSFGRWNIGFQETNTDFLLNANPDLGLPFTTGFTFGGNRRDFGRSDDYTWVAELSSPGIFDVSNASSLPDLDRLESHKRVNSLYGQLDLGFNDYFFLTVTGRNDWSSTLPEANRSYFYPSVSGSLVLSDMLASLEDTPLSYAKVRASWARVGNDTDPYRLRNTYTTGDLFGTVPSSSLSARLENPDLKPEITESWEFGTELGFFENRLGFDVTYYIEETRDQLMPVQLTAASGYASRMLNAGTVENKGWEVLVRGTPVATGDFRWESSLTWAKNEGIVTELAPGVTGLEISLGDFWGATLFAREGEKMGQIVGSAYRRNANGEILTSGGLPLFDNARVIGNVNPDWRAGLSNEFTYRGVRLGVLFDMREGGQIYSVTNAFGRLSGVLEETIPGRCGSGYYPACDATTGIVFDGVDNTSGQPNSTVVDAETYWIRNYQIEEANLEDASYIKLREVTLSYGLPSAWVSRWGVDGVDVSIVGRNLALWTDARHIDPETSLEGTNVQGFEYGQMPSARSFGLNVTVRP
jgi:TonB-linked SusC/RagA family outer membrane protein